MRVNSATAYELMRMDATDQASVVRNGEVSAEELVEASILQIEKLNPALNAVIHPMFEKAQDQIATVHPGAPFAGVPFLVKDILCHTAAIRITSECSSFAGWITTNRLTVSWPQGSGLQASFSSAKPTHRNLASRS